MTNSICKLCFFSYVLAPDTTTYAQAHQNNKKDKKENYKDVKSKQIKKNAQAHQNKKEIIFVKSKISFLIPPSNYLVYIYTQYVLCTYIHKIRTYIYVMWES